MANITTKHETLANNTYVTATDVLDDRWIELATTKRAVTKMVGSSPSLAPAKAGRAPVEMPPTADRIRRRERFVRYSVC
jgi:hypothetical protein